MTAVRKEILWDYRDLLAAKLDKLAKKAAKLGQPFGYHFEGPTRVEEQRAQDPNGPPGKMIASGRVNTYGDVVLDVASVALPGWDFLGTLSPIPTESGEVAMLAFAVPGKSIPQDARDKGLHCDHCHTERRRLETFVVQHESGDVKVVGRNCLRDFLGHDAERIPALFAFLRELDAACDDDYSGGGSRKREAYGLLTLLTVTSAVIRVEGWVSKGYAQKMYDQYNKHLTPTASMVGEWLWGTSKEAIQWRKGVTLTEQDREDAEKAIAFWKATQEPGDYAQNALLIATAGLVPQKAFGLAISLLPSWQRNMARDKQRVEEKAARATAPAWTAGRQDVTGTVLSEKQQTSDYGTQTKWLLGLADGRRLWLTAPAGLLREGAKVGSTVQLTATIQPKDGDLSFAFGSRPSGTKLVA